MDILNQIVQHKKKEIEQRKSYFPTALLERSIYFQSETASLSKYILRPDKSGIIAEIKRKSPSKGNINRYVNVERTSIGYMQAGASALSILTDETFFGGKNEDLTTARKFNFCPILRKDFIIDEYQIIEAKSIGADAILLIAAILNPSEMNHLAQFARSLGLEVLLEVHHLEELKNSLNQYIHLVGVNTRNLKTFEVNKQLSQSLVQEIPKEFIKVAESGIHHPEDLIKLKSTGFQGFLIGETFMKNSQPELACASFINQVNTIAHAQ